MQVPFYKKNCKSELIGQYFHSVYYDKILVIGNNIFGRLIENEKVYGPLVVLGQGIFAHARLGG